MSGRSIKSIRVGDIFEGKLISVGKQIDIKGKTGESTSITVSKIILDIDFLNDFKLEKYNVFVKSDKGIEDIWQSFIRQPVCLTYDW
jgi:hypothetical protein